MVTRRRILLPFTALVLLLASCGSTAPGTGTGSFATDARVTLRTYTALVEQQMSSVLDALAVAAATDAAASGQWSRIRPALAEVADRTGRTTAVWFVRPDGSYDTVASGPVSANLSDRAYFPGLMAGHDVTGDLVVSKSTGREAAVVAVPIRSEGTVIGGLGASVDLVKMSAVVGQAMALPSDMVFYAIDSHGRTAIHGTSQDIFAYPSQMGSPSLANAVHEMLRSAEGSLTYTYQGTERTVVFMRSKLTGWTFALGKVGQ